MMDGIQVRLTNRNILRINLLPDQGYIGSLLRAGCKTS